MLRKLIERLHNEEKGFTLIELLVVMLIIGILAAIALPVFLSQQEKGQDADAKSNARNLVSHVESCYAETQDYQECDTTAAINPSGLAFVPGGPGSITGGQVTVVSADADSFTVTAESEATDDSSNPHSFVISKTNGAAVARTCTSGNSNNDGGCNGGTW